MLLWRVIFSVIAFAVYGIISYNISSRVFSPTGDEPHYLVITHSIARDGDISLLNNYREQHYRIFYDSILPKRTTASADKKREIPTFGLGMPLFLAPWYNAIYDSAPHKLVPYLRLVICLVAAIGVFQLVSLGYDLTRKASATFVIAAGVAFSSPLITYSNEFYPEIFAFVLLLTALRAMIHCPKKPWLCTAVLSVIPGMLMWLHPKYLALGIVLTAITAFLLYRDQGRQFGFRNIVHLIVAIAGIATFFVFLQTFYGSWSPNRIYGGWQKETSLLELLTQEGFERIAIMIKMFFGFWFDQRFGLLPFTPFYVAFFAGVVWIIRRRESAAFPALILFALHFLPMCWGAPLGGYAPPARHFVVMVPFLVVPLFLMYQEWLKMQKGMFLTLQLVAVFIVVQMFANYRSIFANVTWRNPDGGSEFWPLLHLQRWIPNCIANNPEYFLIIIWVIGAMLFAFLLYPRAKQSAPGVIDRYAS